VNPPGARASRTGSSAPQVQGELAADTPRILGDLKLFELITITRLSRYAPAGLTESVVVAWVAVDLMTYRLKSGISVGGSPGGGFVGFLWGTP
jgi:hypothetical protein